MVKKDEVGGNESYNNETNLLNLSVSKKSIEAGYLTFGNAKKGDNNLKRGGSNIKKGVKAAKDSVYLTLDNKKAFNYLRHAFISALIFQYFDLERHI